MRKSALMFTTSVVAVSLASLAACDEFNAKLKERIVSTPANALALADSCETKVPVVESSADPHTLNVSALKGDSSETGCNIKSSVLAGAEGFFEIDAKKGDRWHFHVEAVPGVDPGVYVPDSCSELRHCLASADVCGKGEPEHFTFVPQSSGKFTVVVEGLDPAATTPTKMTIINPVCGDNNKQHSEVCDDGNNKDGDGCDSHCRAELLLNKDKEVEPNDDSFGANVLEPMDPTSPIQVQAALGGATCGPDYYLVRVKDGTLTARVVTASGGECSGVPGMELALLSADKDELREDVLQVATRPAHNGQCPFIEAQLVDEGTYFLRLKRLAPMDEFAYRLDVTLEQ
jgi:cysteine-rich repeat protein